jgi:hypothetical protein
VSSYVPIADLWISLRSGGEEYMAVGCPIRGYVDDSGHASDPEHNVVAMACYVSHLDKWKVFEREWGEVLGDNKIPYLHMKEWWDRNKSIYAHIKGNSAKEASLFSDFSNVIKSNVEFCAISYVRLADLERVSQEYGLKIDAYALLLYGCLIVLRQDRWDEDFHIVIDKVDKPYSKIEKAKAYADADVRHRIRPQKIPITPIEDTESARQIRPLQACDFMAWELRRDSEETLTWNAGDDVKSVVSAARDYGRWATEFKRNKNRDPIRRKSAWSLYRGVRVRGLMWDEVNIRGAHINLHPNGWGV